jgi:predicted DNA-binding protein YlxM (UPF0122 family)
VVVRFFYALFQFLARRKARTEMVAYESNNTTGRRRTRVREVDFMRVEDASTRDALSPFEMEVKNKIAEEMPLKGALDAEELRIKEQLARVFKAKLKKLISKGVLTKRQREFYELFYVLKLTDPEIAERMGVSRVRIRKLRWSLKEALKRAVKKDKEKELMNHRAKYIRLTRNQKTVWRMYQKERLSVADIANRLSNTPQAVYWVLQNLRKKFHG